MAYQVVPAVPSAARTATGQGQAVVDSDRGNMLALQLAVTASSGTTPTLDVALEWSMDGGTTWSPAETADSFTQMTGTGSKVKVFTVKSPTYRVVWTIGGTTPSFTFWVRAFMTN